MRIDSSGNVGIGNSIPSSFNGGANNLVVGSGSGAEGITIYGGAESNIFFADGTSTADSIKGRIEYAHSIDGMRIYTNGLEAMRIDSSGKIGIGTSSPSDYNSSMNNLVVADSGDSGITVVSGTSSEGSIAFADGSSGLDAYRGWINYNHNSNFMRFSTGGTERMRIDSSGKLSVGVAGKYSVSKMTANYDSVSEFGLALRDTGSSSTAAMLQFVKDGNVVGVINSSTTATAYNTSSDYRLKTDAQPMTGASARVQALNPVNFKWISDGSRVDGFLAHEAQAVVPESVTGTKDAMMDEEYEVTPAVLDEDGNVTTEAVMGTRSVPDYQGIDQSKLVPLLTAALQEALTEIESLKTRLTALEG
jgi:hypothetical protein